MHTWEEMDRKNIILRRKGETRYLKGQEKIAKWDLHE